MKNYFFGFLLLCLSACSNREPKITGLEGKPMPNFDLLLADSVTHFNTKDIPSGTSVAFLYFGPWCPYSRAQMEEILNHMKTFKNIHFYVFTRASFGEMKSFYNYYQLNKYSNITAGVDYTSFFGSYYEIPGVPFIAIYGNDKCLKKAFLGQVYTRQLKSTIEN